MRPHVPPEYLVRLHEVVSNAAEARDLTCVAFYLFAEELVENGIAIEDLTLGEICAAKACASERCEKIMKRLEAMNG